MSTASFHVPPTGLKWLEITADYRCNNRCVGCYSLDDDGPSMTAMEIARALAVGRAHGAPNLWLGGGEPTLRRDLFGVVRRAREVGYTRVKLQTNGMLLAYPEFTRRCVEAGVTDVCFGMRGATAETHDRLSATPGCHELMLRGAREAARQGLRIEADYLVYADSIGELAEAVERHSGLGFERFNVWLFSTTDARDQALASQVPRISTVVPHITAAMDLRLGERDDFIVSLHTPPCTVPKSHHACVFSASELGLLIANPGDHYFMLETSPIEGGHYLSRCGDCSMRPGCGGLRLDYLAIHGDAEFSAE